jgi:hypothetical protein
MSRLGPRRTWTAEDRGSDTFHKRGCTRFRFRRRTAQAGGRASLRRRSRSTKGSGPSSRTHRRGSRPSGGGRSGSAQRKDTTGRHPHLPQTTRGQLPTPPVRRSSDTSSPEDRNTPKDRSPAWLRREQTSRAFQTVTSSGGSGASRPVRDSRQNMITREYPKMQRAGPVIHAWGAGPGASLKAASPT